MPGVNRTIVASGFIIMATGLYHYFFQQGNTHTTITRILLGGYMLMLVASILELFGFGIGQIAGLLLMLAVGTSVFLVVSDIVSRYQNNKQAAAGGGGSAGGF